MHRLVKVACLLCTYMSFIGSYQSLSFRYSCAIYFYVICFTLISYFVNRFHISGTNMWNLIVFNIFLLNTICDQDDKTLFYLQAVFKQFGGGGYGGSDNVVTDEAELRLHQKLEKLYISTRAAKVAFHPPVGGAFSVLKNKELNQLSRKIMFI